MLEPTGARSRVPGEPRPWEIGGLYLLFAATVLFGILTVERSAFMQRRMTDLDVYLRAAWAVRTGGEVYRISDDNGWHYHYPPLPAIALTPLADPPPGADRTGMLPFVASVAIWYIFSLLCLIVAIHGLASALEQTSSNPEVRAQRPGCRRWWALRLLPLLICLPPVAVTLARGQVNLLLLALLCGMTAAALRGRSWRAGLWLAAAICLKLIPAFLLLYPLWRRDIRWLAGCAVGLMVGLGVIPAVTFGPARAIACYRDWGELLLRPALTEQGDQARARELTNVTGTDSQSLLATLHNTLHLERATRPATASASVRRAHWLVGGLLTLVTLLAAGWRRTTQGPAAVAFLGVLMLLMILLSPVCHLHYFCLGLPLILALLAGHWESRTSRGEIPPVGKGLALLFGVYLVAAILPRIPGLEVLRDLGVSTYAGLLLWLAGSVFVWQQGRQGATLVRRENEVTGVAA